MNRHDLLRLSCNQSEIKKNYVYTIYILKKPFTVIIQSLTKPAFRQPPNKRAKMRILQRKSSPFSNKSILAVGRNKQWQMEISDATAAGWPTRGSTLKRAASKGSQTIHTRAALPARWDLRLHDPISNLARSTIHNGSVYVTISHSDRHELQTQRHQSSIESCQLRGDPSRNWLSGRNQTGSGQVWTRARGPRRK